MSSASLQALQLDCLDLYLVHWPCADAAPMRMPLRGSARGLAAGRVGCYYSRASAPASGGAGETWRQMEGLVARGLVRSIGVSNASAARLRALLAAPDLAVAPAVNQARPRPLPTAPDLPLISAR